ncbi:hypothetical protein H9L19_03840 [Weissella diestrammenae]|uniref:Uncharacterized protein n=1 Tax=Weissella diestrammenae TaxID=1162633 RepID=A0A7G9T7B6_9LACO|nr:hypothetical protein [Weissella diestrammenae]MCM0582003.1 hypothetical protein [Weissella diestrammenae]QNN75991.1 hypothetical protein H9L19_03840 [Weissella diestrammenae]
MIVQKNKQQKTSLNWQLGYALFLGLSLVVISLVSTVISFSNVQYAKPINWFDVSFSVQMIYVIGATLYVIYQGLMTRQFGFWVSGAAIVPVLFGLVSGIIMHGRSGTIISVTYIGQLIYVGVTLLVQGLHAYRYFLKIPKSQRSLMSRVAFWGLGYLLIALVGCVIVSPLPTDLEALILVGLQWGYLIITAIVVLPSWYRNFKKTFHDF